MLTYFNVKPSLQATFPWPHLKLLLPPLLRVLSLNSKPLWTMVLPPIRAMLNNKLSLPINRLRTMPLRTKALLLKINSHQTRLPLLTTSIRAPHPRTSKIRWMCLLPLSRNWKHSSLG